MRHFDYGQNGKKSVEYEPYITTTLGWAPPSGYAYREFDYRLNGNLSGYLDPAGRLHRIIDFDGATPATYYLGTATRVVDGSEPGTATGGNHVVEISDEHGRVNERFVYEGDSNLEAQLSWRYDGRDSVIEEWFGNDPSTLISKSFDLVGRVILRDDPDSGEWASSYDAAGNVLHVDDPEQNQSVQYCYDERDRVVLECGRSSDSYDAGLCASATPVCDMAYEYSYDEYDSIAGVTSYPIGRVTTIDGPDSSHRLAYDLRGRTISTVDEIGGVSGAYSFDYRPDLDRLTRITYPDGELVAYGYDTAGQPDSLRRVDSQGGTVTTYVDNINYDLRMRPVFIQRGNQASDTYTYHGAGEGFRLATYQAVDDATSTPFVNIAYSDYDLNGRLKTVDDLIWTAGPQSSSAVYDYDGAGRLLSMTTPTASGTSQETFQYDSIGNMTSLNGLSFTFASQLPGESEPHQARQLGDGVTTGFAMDYDANGQRTSKTGPSISAQSYEYDSFGQLRRLTVAGVPKDFGYGPGGIRVSEERQGAIRRFFGRYSESRDGLLHKYYYLGESLVGTLTVSAPSLSGLDTALPLEIPPEIYLGLMALAVLFLTIPLGNERTTIGVRITASRGLGAAVLMTVTLLPLATNFGCGGSQLIRSYHMGHLGSPLAISQHGSQRVSRLYSYSAYGEVSRFNHLGNPRAVDPESRREFTGYQTDEESELQYAQARYYDPSTAQFLSHDPVEVDASPYSYVGWDPVNYVDPNGETSLEAFLVFLIIGAALVVAQSIYNAVSTGSAWNFFKGVGMGAASLGTGIAFGAVLYGVSVGLSAVYSMAGLGYSFYGAIHSSSLAEGLFAGAGIAVSIASFAYGAENPVEETATTIDEESQGGMGGEAADAGRVGKPPNAAEGGGAEVVAVRDGEVLKSGWQDPNNHGKDLGWRTVIGDSDGYDAYGHLEPGSTLEPGTKVRAGDVIGRVADPTNGYSNGPHVHVGRWDYSKSAWVNPGRTPAIVGGRISGKFGRLTDMHPKAPGHLGVDWVAR